MPSFKSYNKDVRLIGLLLDIRQSVLAQQVGTSTSNHKDIRGQDKAQQEQGGSQSARKPILRFLAV